MAGLVSGWVGCLVSGWLGYLVSGWISEWLGGLPCGLLGGWKALSVTVVKDVLILQTCCCVHRVVCLLPLEPAIHSLLFVALFTVSGWMWLEKLRKWKERGLFRLIYLLSFPVVVHNARYYYLVSDCGILDQAATSVCGV